MSNLAENWEKRKTIQFCMPTTIRLSMDNEEGLQLIKKKFPHLTQTQIINDLIADGLERVFRQT